ncbi:hypothetical protein FSP39_004660 [Pinctada imbricata]|uniref:Probable RNA-binding protein 18 n=1 Tax=Pinctada imbricata TaxID=66713 RepID=A0AA88XTR2_PINIB|nr:hypothetical protein FSP39_004660 [Pinctada imbricata]
MENPIRHEFDGSRKFNLQFDVQQFRPEEISVKTSGNQLTVHARHEEADSSGKKSYREYYRQYVLPKDVNPEFLNSKLTRNGTLQIEAPLPPLASSGHKGSMQDCIPVPADPEDPSENKLWIGNLDHRLTELSLIKILQKYGKLKKFDFLYHKSGPDVGKPRGFCFVTYEEKHDAERAIQKMNGKLALSKKLIVKWARKETQGSMQDCIPVPADPEDPSENKLWIGNLDHRLTELSLIKILQKYGKLKKFDFLYHKSGPDVGKPRGFCFVTYEEKHDAERAIQKMNGKLALSKKLIVKWARKETQVIPESQIKAIEAKLKLMERNNIDFSLDRKPVIAPGSSQLSAANIEARRKMEASTKPYTKRTVKR